MLHPGDIPRSEEGVQGPWGSVRHAVTVQGQGGSARAVCCDCALCALRVDYALAEVKVEILATAGK